MLALRQVCRAPLGPGLWPGLAVRPAGSPEAPRARVGPEDPFCGAVRKDLRVPLRVEGAARTMRGVPSPCQRPFRRSRSSACLTAWSSLPGAASGVTAGTARGRSPGPPGAAARRARWASAHRVRRTLPPRQRRPAPDLTPAAYGGVTLAVDLPFDWPRPLLAFTSRPSGTARPRCALEAVEKLVTGPDGAHLMGHS